MTLNASAIAMTLDGLMPLLRVTLQHADDLVGRGVLSTHALAVGRTAYDDASALLAQLRALSAPAGDRVDALRYADGFALQQLPPDPAIAGRGAGRFVLIDTRTEVPVSGPLAEEDALTMIRFIGALQRIRDRALQGVSSGSDVPSVAKVALNDIAGVSARALKEALAPTRATGFSESFPVGDSHTAVPPATVMVDGEAIHVSRGAKDSDDFTLCDAVFAQIRAEEAYGHGAANDPEAEGMRP